MTYMSMQWGNRRWWRVLMFGSIAIAALYLGLLSPLQRATPVKHVSSIAQFAAPAASPAHETIVTHNSPRTGMGAKLFGGVVGGVPRQAQALILAGLTDKAQSTDRMIVRNGTLALVVAHPAQSVDNIIRIAQAHGGYVVSSQVSGQKETEAGQITIRIPAAQFDPVREELKKIAQTIDSEQISADDVTMQYSENEATLRNYRAEEASYLEIMKRSGRIKDTLEVAEQLSDVRGRIERMTASQLTMQHQSEMTALTITLHTEPVAVTNEWRPLYQLKLAWNEGADALADYATTMMGVLLRLPAVLAWIITLTLGVKLGWMLLQLALRLFRAPKPQPAAS